MPDTSYQPAQSFTHPVRCTGLKVRQQASAPFRQPNLNPTSQRKTLAPSAWLARKNLHRQRE